MTLTIQFATSPKWANAEQSLIDLLVQFDAIPEPIPYTASAADSVEHSRELFARAVAGEFGPVAPYVAPPVVPPTPEQIEALRRAAYQAEADPLFFKSQRGEATHEDWLAKVAEIKARFPE
jgi:hypothetical protein